MKYWNQSRSKEIGSLLSTANSCKHKKMRRSQWCNYGCKYDFMGFVNKTSHQNKNETSRHLLNTFVILNYGLEYLYLILESLEILIPFNGCGSEY